MFLKSQFVKTPEDEARYEMGFRRLQSIGFIKHLPPKVYPEYPHEYGLLEPPANQQNNRVEYRNVFGDSGASEYDWSWGIAHIIRTARNMRWYYGNAIEWRVIRGSDGIVIAQSKGWQDAESAT